MGIGPNNNYDNNNPNNFVQECKKIKKDNLALPCVRLAERCTKYVLRRRRVFPFVAEKVVRFSLPSSDRSEKNGGEMFKKWRRDCKY